MRTWELVVPLLFINRDPYFVFMTAAAAAENTVSHTCKGKGKGKVVPVL
jgi:hypothetical protein